MSQPCNVSLETVSVKTCNISNLFHYFVTDNMESSNLGFLNEIEIHSCSRKGILFFLNFSLLYLVSTQIKQGNVLSMK